MRDIPYLLSDDVAGSDSFEDVILVIIVRASNVAESLWPLYSRMRSSLQFVSVIIPINCIIVINVYSVNQLLLAYQRRKTYFPSLLFLLFSIRFHKNLAQLSQVFICGRFRFCHRNGGEIRRLDTEDPSEEHCKIPIFSQVLLLEFSHSPVSEHMVFHRHATPWHSPFHTAFKNSFNCKENFCRLYFSTCFAHF